MEKLVSFRALRPDEIAGLQFHDHQRALQKKSAQFTPEDLQKLSTGGTAVTFKLFNTADKILEEQRTHMQRPPSRDECWKTYVRKQEFIGYAQGCAGFFEEYIALRELLIEAKITTKEAIDARVAKRIEDVKKAAMAAKESVQAANGGDAPSEEGKGPEDISKGIAESQEELEKRGFVKEEGNEESHDSAPEVGA